RTSAGTHRAAPAARVPEPEETDGLPSALRYGVDVAVGAITSGADGTDGTAAGGAGVGLGLLLAPGVAVPSTAVTVGSFGSGVANESEPWAPPWQMFSGS